jgi:hypothetical protein
MYFLSCRFQLFCLTNAYICAEMMTHQVTISEWSLYIPTASHSRTLHFDLDVLWISHDSVILFVYVMETEHCCEVGASLMNSMLQIWAMDCCFRASVVFRQGGQCLKFGFTDLDIALNQ